MDDIVIHSSDELKNILAVVRSRQAVRMPREIVLNDNIEEYSRLSTYCDIFGVSGYLRDVMLTHSANVGLSKALRSEDLLIRLNMIDDDFNRKVEVIDLDKKRDDYVED